MEELTNNIKLWITYDTKVAELTNTLKILRENKSIIETKIIDTLKYNNLTNKDIKINNFKLNVHKTSNLAPLTLTLLGESLNGIVDENTKIRIFENIKLIKNKQKKDTICLKKKILKK
jgi:hypothetical protein